jgi:glycosyltransferase involved in cell wall biosynthesis
MSVSTSRETAPRGAAPGASLRKAPPLRALHVINWLNPGGIESWILQILRQADRAELAIDVCCKGTHRGELADEAIAAGAAVLHVPMGRWGPWSRRFRRQLASVLRAGRYDVVHSHLGDLSEPVLDAAIAAGVPKRIAMYHLVEHRLEKHPLLRVPLQRWQRRVRRRLVRKATAVLGCSTSSLRALFDDPGAPGLGVLHPAVEVERFDPRAQGGATAAARAAVREQLGVDADVPLVINVGNLGYAKNQVAILEAARRLRDRGVSARFAIVGIGPLRADLESRIQALGLSAEVQLLGSRRDVPRILWAADVAVHPSVAEGLPVAVLEYQAAGLPVVGSDIPSVLEALAPAHRRFVAATDDPERLADSLIELLRSPALRAELAVAGKSWVAEHFSTERSVRALRALYGAPGAEC